MLWMGGGGSEGGGCVCSVLSAFIAEGICLLVYDKVLSSM